MSLNRKIAFLRKQLHSVGSQLSNTPERKNLRELIQNARARLNYFKHLETEDINRQEVRNLQADLREAVRLYNQRNNISMLSADDFMDQYDAEVSRQD